MQQVNNQVSTNTQEKKSKGTNKFFKRFQIGMFSLFVHQVFWCKVFVVPLSNQFVILQINKLGLFHKFPTSAKRLYSKHLWSCTTFETTSSPSTASHQEGASYTYSSHLRSLQINSITIKQSSLHTLLGTIKSILLMHKLVLLILIQESVESQD